MWKGESSGAPTPMTETGEGILGPEYEIGTEKLASVSIRNKMGLSTAFSSSLGSARMMEGSQAGVDQSVL